MKQQLANIITQDLTKTMLEHIQESLMGCWSIGYLRGSVDVFRNRHYEKLVELSTEIKLNSTRLEIRF